MPNQTLALSLCLTTTSYDFKSLGCARVEDSPNRTCTSCCAQSCASSSWPTRWARPWMPSITRSSSLTGHLGLNSNQGSECFFFVLSILWSLVKCNFQIFFWINFGYTLKKLWLHNYVHTCLLLLSKWTSFKFVKCERIFERKSLRNSSNENNWVRSKRLKHLLLLSL